MEALGLDPIKLLVQFVAFGGLIILMYRFAYNPVLKVIDERAQRIREGMETAEAIKRERAETEERAKQQLDESRKEAQAIVARAHEIGERTVAESTQRAREEAEKIIERARAEIRLEKEQAMADLRKSVADLVVLAASRVVGQSLDTQSHYRLIDEVISESGNLQQAD